MAESIAQRTAAISNTADAVQLYKALNALYTDVAALRAALVAVTAKLDADGGVTDTNYAATCNPAALSSAA